MSLFFVVVVFNYNNIAFSSKTLFPLSRMEVGPIGSTNHVNYHIVFCNNVIVLHYLTTSQSAKKLLFHICQAAAL